MTRYVAGFAFDSGLVTQVLLIRKKKPAWQKGKLNGVGGKIEQNETTLDAMVREFKEEAGIQTQHEDWKCFCIMAGEDWQVSFLTTRTMLCFAKQTTDEELLIVDRFELGKHDVIPNLHWLIPLAIQCDDYKHVIRVKEKTH